MASSDAGAQGVHPSHYAWLRAVVVWLRAVVLAASSCNPQAITAMSVLSFTRLQAEGHRELQWRDESAPQACNAGADADTTGA